MKTEIIVPGDPPIMPDYLTPAAILVWQETIGRVMAAGISEADSSLFARYCSLEAEVRIAFKSGGDLPSAAYLTNLRQMEELLRIAGPKSRIGGGSADGAKPGNRFARNGARARIA
ncbi:hypothetical protein [Sphingomonas sp. MMS24-J13]|uniref:hypothetical protein n=1 Tax=Sphingomonas sp. MMS24-J13 TaxID=3238686 RepID=UPI0038516A26